MAGSANTAAMALDSLKCPQILGSIAGDDTILVVVADNESVAEVEELLRSMTV
jgi:transcriptional regulator of arginine metabolism